MKIARVLFTGLLLTYATGLCFAALAWGPLWYDPPPLAFRARALFERVGIVPGLALFYDPNRSSRDPIANCVEVFGRVVVPSRPRDTSQDRSGRHLLHHARSCDPDHIQLSIDPIDMMLTRIFYDAYSLMLDGKKQVRPNLQTQAKALLASIPDFYCRKAEDSHASTDEIEFTWSQKIRDLGVEDDVGLMTERMRAVWSCTERRYLDFVWHSSIGPKAAPHD